jgi:hypothetical protein
MSETLQLSGVEKRLQERYEQMVQEQTGHAHPVAAGPRHLPRDEVKAAVQAAWRFYKNPRTKTDILAQPLLRAARAAVAAACERYVLVMGDWCHLDYRTHTDKLDRIQIGQKEEIGYELFSQLAVSDKDGQPLAPVCLRLQAAAGVYSTEYDGARPPQSQLDELGPVMEHTAGLQLGQEPVFFFDAEVDSIFHFRSWASKRLFVIRGDEERVVLFEDKETAVSDLVAVLRQRQAFQQVREVEYKGEQVFQYVAEAAVVLHRKAQLHRKVNGKKRHIYVKGEPLPLRLVVSELRRTDGTVVARWLLWTNLPADVDAATVALWYYWRWKIESYFKLLKGAGQQVEQWQQETGERILKRLLVASMACVLVWQLARSVAPEASAARELLVRLSGRQMEYGKEFTREALLAGLWTLLTILDSLEEYLPEQLRHLADFILGGSGCLDSS